MATSRTRCRFCNLNVQFNTPWSPEMLLCCSEFKRGNRRHVAASLVVHALTEPNTGYSRQQKQGDEDEKVGTSLTVAALWSLDLAMNASLVAIRAVVADCAPPRQQVLEHVEQNGFFIGNFSALSGMG